MRATAFLVLALLLTGCDRLPQGNHFALQPDTAGNIWRIDTQTGETQVCSHRVADFPPTCEPVAIQHIPAFNN